MSWIESVNSWRQLPAEEKLLRRWRAIPHDVAQSMAFEREPVEISRLQEILGQIGLPDSSKQHSEPSPTRS
jgi:hypothetical protein